MSERFPSHFLQNYYASDKDSFKNELHLVSIDSVPSYANIISSVTIFKPKPNYDEDLKLKASIEPHGTEDSLRYKI